MKKLILAAAVFALMPFTGAFAQQGFHAGLTTGYYRTLILDKGLFDSPTYEHTSTLSAAPIGLALGYQWDSGNGIQLEVIKAKIGQEFDIMTLTGPGGDFKVSGAKEIELDYIQVPLLFKLQAGEKKTRFSFMFGPQISFLQDASDVETYSATPLNFTGTNNYATTPTSGEHVIGSSDGGARYTFNDMAVGGVLGFGIDYYATESLYISGNLRFGYNFTEIRNEDDNGGNKFVDTPRNTGDLTAPNTELYVEELRTAAYGGLQVGVHYLFGQ